VHAWRQPKITGGHIAIRKSPPVPNAATRACADAGQRHEQAHSFFRVTQLGEAFFDALLFGLELFKQVQKAVNDHAVGRGEDCLAQPLATRHPEERWHG
jgi:hypothetical protein